MRRPAPDWVDEVAVERALQREPVGRPLTHAERIEVTRTLILRKVTVTEVRRYLRLSGTNALVIYREAEKSLFPDLQLESAS